MAEQGNPNRYKIKRKTAKEAISMIGSGQRVFVGSSCGEPQHLVDALLDHKGYISDLEVMRLLSLEGAITALYSDQAYGRNFTVRSIYQGSGSTENLSGSRRFLTPMNISAIPRLFKSRQLPIHIDVGRLLRRGQRLCFIPGNLRALRRLQRSRRSLAAQNAE